MLRSFRVRMALLSALLSGLLLAVFGVFAWRLIYRTSLEQVDAMLRDLARIHLALPRDAQHWARLDESLAGVYGGVGGAIIRVEDAEGLLYQSLDWPFENALAAPGPLQPPDPRMPVPLFGPARARLGAGGQDGGPRGEPPRAGRDGLAPGPFEPNPWSEDLQGLPPPEERFRAGAPPRRPQVGGPLPPGPPGAQRGPRGPQPLPLRQARFEIRVAGDEVWRVGAFGNPEVTLHAAAPLSAFRADLAAARTTLLLGLPLALLCIAAGSWWLAGRALRPVDRLTAAIAGVTARGLDQRIAPAVQERELTRLVDMFNAMLARLQGSFEQTMRFSADAAHELKTPLTIIQGELERAIRTAPPGQQETLAGLLAIVQKLLRLALADAGQLPLQIEPAPLSVLAEELADDARILAAGQEVTARIAPDLIVQADPHLLRQAMQNLVSNAVKYTPPGGKLYLELRQDGERVRFTVQNTAKLSAEARARVFDRFYRGDRARSRQVEGTGLGLSLAREIMRAHGGGLELEPTPEGIVSFTLWLGRHAAPPAMP